MCIRPAADKAARVAALPYDVYNRKEACEAVKGNPLSLSLIHIYSGSGLRPGLFHVPR